MPDLQTTYSWTKDGEIIFGLESEDLTIHKVDKPENSTNSIYECTATSSDPKFEGNKINEELILQNYFVIKYPKNCLK